MAKINPKALARLRKMAEQIRRESTSDEAESFDAEVWLKGWLIRPQPALGGRQAVEMLDTADGLEAVLRLLGSSVSGAYQ